MVAQLIHRGFIFQIDQPARIDAIKRSLPVRGFFTEPASIPDLNPPKLGLYMIGFARGQIDKIGIGVHTGTPSTLSARIKIKKVVSLPNEILLTDALGDSDAENIIRDIIVSQNQVVIDENIINGIIRYIVRMFPRLEEDLNKIITIVNGIDFSENKEKSALFAIQQDALRAAILGLGVSWQSFEDRWEPDNYDDDITYLDGFPELGLSTEDDIIPHELQFFPNFVKYEKVNLKTVSFTDGKTNVLITMANRNAFEDVFGVDLIYYNEETNSYCFIQYKRMEKGKTTFAYYPSSDKNYQKDMDLMEKHTETFNKYDTSEIEGDLNGLYSNYRMFGGPFFFKFVYSVDFEPFKNKIAPGFCVPFDMWKSFVNECKNNGETLKAATNTLHKHIGPNHFCDLLKRGMIGSRACSTEAVIETLDQCLKGNRSAVFAFKPIPFDDAIPEFDIDE